MCGREPPPYKEIIIMYPWHPKTSNQRTLLNTILGDDFFNFGNTNFIDDYSVRTNVASDNEEYRIDVVAPVWTRMTWASRLRTTTFTFLTIATTRIRPSWFVIVRLLVIGSFLLTRIQPPSVPSTSRASFLSSFPAKPLPTIPLILTLSDLKTNYS